MNFEKEMRMMVTEQMVDLMIELNNALEGALDDDYSDIMNDVLSESEIEFTEEQIEFCLENYQEYAECFSK